MDYFSAALSIKTVNVAQRIISGYAAAHHNIDRVNDIIDPQASTRAVRRIRDPKKDVAAFIGHDSSQLPVGIPQRIEATPQGLYTETYVLKGPAGDNLLAVAKDLQDHGHSLGMSIGYKTHDSRHETAAGKRVRRILDYELKEYSFAAHQVVANPMATVTDVKARKAMSEGSDSAGGYLPQGRRKGTAMEYTVKHEGDKYVVYCGEEVVGSYDDARTANAVRSALAKEYDDGEENKDDGMDMADGKTDSYWPSTKAAFDRLSSREKMALHAELLQAGVI